MWYWATLDVGDALEPHVQVTRTDIARLMKRQRRGSFRWYSAYRKPRAVYCRLYRASRMQRMRGWARAVPGPLYTFRDRLDAIVGGYEWPPATIEMLLATCG